MTADEARAAPLVQRDVMNRPGFLLAQHGLAMNARMRKAMELAGRKPRRNLALMYMAAYGPVSQHALAKALGVDPSVLVLILNDLERDKVAIRRRDPADRRRHIVELTRSGLDAVADLEKAVAAVEREAFADLDDVEMARLYELLSRVRTAGGDLCDED